MVLENSIQGRYVNLRSVVETDAEVTWKFRQNKEKTKFLHRVDGTVEDQRKWIIKQNTTEGDYFFLVEDKEGNPVGTVGVSEIVDRRGHIGRLLSYGNAFQSIESYALLIRFCFDKLNLIEVYGDTDIANRSAMEFIKIYGAVFDEPYFDKERNGMITISTINEDQFNNAMIKLKKMLYR